MSETNENLHPMRRIHFDFDTFDSLITEALKDGMHPQIEEASDDTDPIYDDAA